MPYVGEIRMFGGNFPPADWEFCSGQLLSISENETLFQLIGTTYGGDGQSTFALPDLRGRVPIHMGTNAGNSYQIGQLAGSETQGIGLNQLPAHTHGYTYQPVASSSSGSQVSPQNAYYAGSGRKGYYSPVANANATMAAVGTSTNTGTAGNNSPPLVEVVQPYLVVSFIISLYGVFPSP